MNKTIASLVTLLAACGAQERPRPTDAELHERIDCAWDNGNYVCERPCAGEFRGEYQIEGNACVTQIPQGLGQTEWKCRDIALFEYEGVMGCCVQPNLSQPMIYFAVCEGE